MANTDIPKASVRGDSSNHVNMSSKQVLEEISKTFPDYAAQLKKLYDAIEGYGETPAALAVRDKIDAYVSIHLRTDANGKKVLPSVAEEAEFLRGLNELAPQFTNLDRLVLYDLCIELIKLGYDERSKKNNQTQQTRTEVSDNLNIAVELFLKKKPHVHSPQDITKQEDEIIGKLNYRKHYFHLFGKDLQIAGMAGPHFKSKPGDDFVDRSLDYLKQHEQRDVLIGLNDKHDFSEKASEHGLQYYYFPITDYVDKPDSLTEPIPPKIYDAIYTTIKEATEEGKKVSIHCGAGDGRTGTALACLKLRELLEAQAQLDPSTLDSDTEATCSVYSLADMEFYKCTLLVNAAVQAVRYQREADNSYGRMSVESENDIKTLILYEQHLRRILKAELKDQQLTVPDVNENAQGLTDDESDDEIDISPGSNLLTESLPTNNTVDSIESFKKMKDRVIQLHQDQEADKKNKGISESASIESSSEQKNTGV